jgi:prephenate dehydratase
MKARAPGKGPFFLTNFEMKIAIQGEKGSFHDVAARQYFGSDTIELVECPTFDMTVNTAKQGIADFAVMAIENARSGSILYNYTLLRESGLKVFGEHNVRIKQNLMALPGQMITGIREIRSHPIALAQCMEFLNQYPEITLIESADTAGSARIISENNLYGVAAIGPSSAAKIYDLNILAEGIETYKKNYTRFLVIGNKENQNFRGNKVSVCFATGHKPGSLAAVLVLLAEMNINLSKIQSVPRLNGDWEYMFYLDLELGNETNAGMVEKALEKHTSNMEVLGVYNKDNMLYES